MLSTQLSEELRAFLARREEFAPLLQFVGQVQAKNTELRTSLEGFTTSSEQWNGIANNVHHLFIRMGEASQGRRASSIFDSARLFSEALERVSLEAVTSRLRGQLRQLMDAFDDYLEHRSAMAGSKLLQVGSDFGASLDALMLLAENVADVLEPVALAGPGRLFLLVEGDLSVEEIAEYLDTIAKLYRRFAGLAGLGDNESALQVRKIETGSLLVDLLGNEQVVGLLIGAVSAFFGWSYRRYSAEGRLKSFADAAASVEKALDLRKRFSEAGVPVERLDVALVEAEAATAEDLLKLFDRGRGVRVNDRVYRRVEPVWSDSPRTLDSLSADEGVKQLPPPKGWGDW